MTDNERVSAFSDLPGVSEFLNDRTFNDLAFINRRLLRSAIYEMERAGATMEECAGVLSVPWTTVHMTLFDIARTRRAEGRSR